MPALRIATLLLFPVTLAAQQQPERRTVAGDARRHLQPRRRDPPGAGTGGDVVVELTRGGPDAGKLEIATGPVRGAKRWRVIYPDDEIVYRGPGSRLQHHPARAGRRARSTTG